MDKDENKKIEKFYCCAGHITEDESECQHQNPYVFYLIISDRGLSYGKSIRCHTYFKDALYDWENTDWSDPSIEYKKFFAFDVKTEQIVKLQEFKK